MKVRKTTTCHTCRARKLGCDGKTPACTQCLFTGRQCAGYQHDFIFVPHQPSRTRPALRKDSRESSKLAKGNVMLATIPASMPAKRFPLEACSALIISKYAPWLMRSSGYSCPATPPYQICGSWVGLLPKLLVGGAFDSILPSAVITLGLSISCNDTLRRGPTSTLARTHCLALSLLRKSLLRADGPFQTDLVAASMCLSLAERMLPTCEEGSMAHLKGVGNVLQLSGPGEYSTGVSYQLFMGIRSYIIFEAFQSRKSCFLALEEWQTIPFLIYPATPLQAMLNHAALIPSLLETFDSLMKFPSETDLPVAQEIWTMFDEVLELLYKWEQFYRLGIEKPSYWPRASQAVLHPFPGTGSRESFWFPNIFVANAFTHLWAFRIICIIHCEKLESQFPELPSKNFLVETDPITESAERNAITLSIWICKSMEYLMQDEGRFYGPVSTLFPLRVVYKIFKLDLSLNQEQLDWCQRIVDQLVFKGIDLTSLL